MSITSFGDNDPEDAWDRGDPLSVLVPLLKRIAADVIAEARLLPRGHPRRERRLDNTEGDLRAFARNRAIRRRDRKAFQVLLLQLLAVR